MKRKKIKEIVGKRFDAKFNPFRKFYFYILFEVWKLGHSNILIGRCMFTCFKVKKWELKYFALARFLWKGSKGNLNDVRFIVYEN